MGKRGMHQEKTPAPYANTRDANGREGMQDSLLISSKHPSAFSCLRWSSSCKAVSSTLKSCRSLLKTYRQTGELTPHMSIEGKPLQQTMPYYSYRMEMGSRHEADLAHYSHRPFPCPKMIHYRVLVFLDGRLDLGEMPQRK